MTLYSDEFGTDRSSGLNKIPVCQGIGIDMFYCIYIYIYNKVFYSCTSGFMTGSPVVVGDPQFEPAMGTPEPEPPMATPAPQSPHPFDPDWTLHGKLCETAGRICCPPVSLLPSGFCDNAMNRHTCSCPAVIG
jgi:hypothetical protein